MHCSNLYRPPSSRPLCVPTVTCDSGRVAFDPVEISAPAPAFGFDIWVFSASGFVALPGFRASGKVGLTAIEVAPQASQLVEPVFNFLPQFVQNVMDVVL